MRGEFWEKEGRGLCTAPELDLEHEKLGFERILIPLFFNYASFDSEIMNLVMSWRISKRMMHLVKKKAST